MLPDDLSHASAQQYQTVVLEAQLYWLTFGSNLLWLNQFVSSGTASFLPQIWALPALWCTFYALPWMPGTWVLDAQVVCFHDDRNDSNYICVTLCLVSSSHWGDDESCKLMLFACVWCSLCVWLVRIRNYCKKNKQTRREAEEDRQKCRHAERGT